MVKKQTQEQHILKSKTPYEYIDRCTDSSLTQGEKARLCYLWLAKHKKYTYDDISKARNRHPYWKKVKGKGSADRTRVRLSENRYVPESGFIPWDQKRIKQFISITNKLSDVEIAKRMKTTLPAVNYMRRKMELIARIKEKTKKNIKLPEDIKLMSIGEKALRLATHKSPSAIYAIFKNLE